MCAAVLYCDEVVVAHAGRNDAESLIVGKMELLHFIEELLGAGELTVQLRRVIGVASHTHYAAQLNVLKCLPLATGKQFTALLWGEAELGLLLCDMYLQQAWYPAPRLCTLPVHFAQQSVAVDAVYEVYEWGNVLDLVCLQVPYEMPVDVFGQRLVLYCEVLCLAFAKVTLSGIVGGLYRLCGVIF